MRTATNILDKIKINVIVNINCLDQKEKISRIRYFIIDVNRAYLDFFFLKYLVFAVVSG